MSSALTDKLIENMAKHLDEYRGLVAKRLEIQGRLEKADAEKDFVKESIFERVFEDYKRELGALDDAIEPLRKEVDKIRQEVNDNRGKVREQISEAEDNIEELTFRRRVGEFDEATFTKREKPVRERIDELTRQEKEFDRILKQIEDAERGVDSSVQKPVADLADPEADDPIESPPTEDAQASPDRTPASETAPSKKKTRQAEHAESPALKPTPSMDKAPAKKEATRPSGEKAAPAADESPAGKKAQARDDSGNGASETIDTSGWAEELQRDLEQPDKSVHIRNRRATDNTASDGDDPIRSTSTSGRMAGDKPSQGFPNLVIIKGTGAGKKIPLLTLTMTIGREHDNNIEIKDEEVARYHARLTHRDGVYHIEDLGSSTGTWVNGEKVDGKVLTHGDKITLGKTELLIDFE
jgi:hypothetical protein